MRLLSRLTVALIVCLIAIALPAIPAQANCSGPDISLVPGSGVPGTQLIVQGVRFDPNEYIDIYYDGVLESQGTKTDTTGDFSIPFTVPESCKGDHQIVVDVASSVLGTVELKTGFYATPGLTVSPGEGPVGTTVTVTGHGFIEDENAIQVMYYTASGYVRVGMNIVADANGYWQTTFSVPASKRGQHKIDAQGQFSQTYDVKDASFTVTAGISIDKSSGMVGDSVTMSGTRFEPYEKDIRILFSGQPVVTGIKADGDGNWEKTFDLPELPAGNYTVTADGQYTAQQDIVPLSFQIASDIVLSAYEGYVGMNVTVTGHGFIADKAVSIMYDGDQQATAVTDDQGNFEGTFPVPQSQHGEHQVTIGYSATSTAAATFTLESDPPGTPLLVSPSNGTRVGLVGRVATPAFEWSVVTDDSGVSYKFQIATSPDITAAGDFANPIVSVTGLTGTSYTVTQALPHGTYYWIVQAVDGAQNQGSWTTPRMLRVGLIPLWAFIVIIVAIIVLIIALGRALVRRRRYLDSW
jgi:hypothetical protein